MPATMGPCMLVVMIFTDLSSRAAQLLKEREAELKGTVLIFQLPRKISKGPTRSLKRGLDGVSPSSVIDNNQLT